MESDKLIGKLVMWILLLQEYDFEVIHRAGITNLDADRLSRNPNYLDENLIGARWHGDCDREAVPSWHASAYLTLFSTTTVEILILGSDNETNRPQINANIWEDLPILHKLQQGTFPLPISAIVAILASSP